MPYTIAVRNGMLNTVYSLITYAALHAGDPGDTGINEVTGGSPAYARKPITFAAPSSGECNAASSLPIQFDVPAGTTVTHIGYWSAQTNGTFYGSAAIANEIFSGQGTVQVTSASLKI